VPVAIPPPSHANLAGALPRGIHGVATAAMSFNPTAFVNQASGSSAGSINQTHKYTTLPQRSFTPSAVAEASRFNAMPMGPSAVPQAALVPQVVNPKAVSKIRAQLGRLTAGGGQLPEMLQQIHQQALAEKDRENPHTKRHRLATVLTWCTLIEATFPGLDESRFWHTDIVRSFARTYLRLRVSLFISFQIFFFGSAKHSLNFCGLGGHDSRSRSGRTRESGNSPGLAYTFNPLHP
jgi:hypothetical protein